MKHFHKMDQVENTQTKHYSKHLLSHSKINKHILSHSITVKQSTTHSYPHNTWSHASTLLHPLSFKHVCMNVRKWILFHSCIHYLETPFSDFAQIKGVPRLKLFYSSRVLFFIFANPLKKQRSVLFGLLVCLSVKAVCFCSIWICFDCFFLFFFAGKGLTT